MSVTLDLGDLHLLHNGMQMKDAGVPCRQDLLGLRKFKDLDLALKSFRDLGEGFADNNAPTIDIRLLDPLNLELHILPGLRIGNALLLRVEDDRDDELLHGRHHRVLLADHERPVLYLAVDVELTVFLADSTVENGNSQRALLLTIGKWDLIEEVE